MAKVQDPKKHFNYTINSPGLNPWLAQKVTIPDFEVDVVEHGDTNYLVKTGGIMKFGNIMVEKISPSTGIDNWVWDWIKQVQDVFIGGGQLPQIYKRPLEIIHFQVDNITILDIFQCEGCWPNKINGIELNRATSENTLESIELCTDRVIKRR